MANVIGQTHRAATHLMSSVANITEACDIVSEIAIIMAEVQALESRAELAEKQQEVFKRFPHLKPVSVVKKD